MKKWTRRLAAPFLALALVGSVVTYECVKPSSASAAAVPARCTGRPPLDANSVSALTALDTRYGNVGGARHARGGQRHRDVEEQAGQCVQSDAGRYAAVLRTRKPIGGRTAPSDSSSDRTCKMQPRGPQIEHGMGSGVVISPDGYIVTNNHVIDGCGRHPRDHERPPSAEGEARGSRSADRPCGPEGEMRTNLASVPWGDSTQVRPGQTVLAFGNPYGFRFTVTRGIVSAVNRANPDSNRSKPGEFIQTDAAINPGNSGGPLVDSRGQVVGINTFLVSPSGSFSGMGFAIPTQIVKANGGN